MVAIICCFHRFVSVRKLDARTNQTINRPEPDHHPGPVADIFVASEIFISLLSIAPRKTF